MIDRGLGFVVLAMMAIGTVAGIILSGTAIMAVGSSAGLTLAAVYAFAHFKGSTEWESRVGTASLLAAALFAPMLLAAAVTGIEWSRIVSSILETFMRGTLFLFPTHQNL